MPQSPFSVLGLPVRFGLTRAELEARWKDLSKAMHPDRHVHASPGERRQALSRAIAINEAYRTLSDELSRADAILRLRGLPAGDGGPAEPQLLMEIMELREALAERRAAGDAAGIGTLADRVRRDAQAATEALTSALDGPSGRAEALPDGSEARRQLSRLRYFRRFLDEVELAREALDAS